MQNDIFIVTSVINTGNKPWSYSSQRSYFTTEERFEQTLKTIQSIRDLNDNSKIILVECSELNEIMRSKIESLVDYYIDAYDDLDVRNACLDSDKKGYGELKQTQKGCEYIRRHNLEFNRIFKICGRYYLNSNFNKSKFDDKDKYSIQMWSPNQGSTIMYSIPHSLFDHFNMILNEYDQYYKNNSPLGYEILLPSKFSAIHNVGIVGVSGYCAVKNDKGFSEFIQG